MAERREEWAREAPSLDASRLVFVDESGVNVDMARAYSRARGGARAVTAVPAGTPTSTTVCAAVRLDGTVVHATWTGGTTGERFVAWVREALAPALRPGDVVVMDNLGAHHVAEVEEALREAGAEARYLPPYSPDLNPIEKMWSKMKALMRGWAVRAADALPGAVGDALSLVTASDCEGWYKSCGYGC